MVSINEDKPPSDKDNLRVGAGRVSAPGSLVERFKGMWADNAGVAGVRRAGTGLHNRYPFILNDFHKA